MVKRKAGRPAKSAVYLVSSADSRSLGESVLRVEKLVEQLCGITVSLHKYVERLELRDAAAAARRSAGAKAANAARAVAAQIADQGGELGELPNGGRVAIGPAAPDYYCAHCQCCQPNDGSEACIRCGAPRDVVP